ncbi:MAG: threonine/serine dehydratase [Granulosicoccus sp.]|nr:threonine/serine dehydratase [Granulosicoccus sp.]
MATTTMPAEAITIDDIQAARERLKPVAVVTPLLENPFINELAGRRVLVKAECLQRTGSFKFRGGWSALSHLSDAEKKRGVIAYSSGNHAQAIALSAQLLGVKASIIMPNDAPELKLANTRAYGAEVILYDRPGGENREEIGARLSEKHGLTLIKPYDHPQVIAGQGTCGLELAEQAQAMGVTQAEVLVCCGGGGLTSGTALACEHLAEHFTVRPVEPESSDDVCRSLISGQREVNTVQSTSICDAIVTPSPGELTFPILKRLCGAGLSVSDKEAMQAVKTVMLRLKLIAEPGGAVALAAALNQQNQIQTDTVICVISGGNIDPAVMMQCLHDS